MDICDPMFIMTIIILIILIITTLIFCIRKIAQKREFMAMTGDIDVVYTWVDGSDIRWLKKKAKYSAKDDPNVNNDSNTSERYKGIYEMKYSLRSLEKNMDWIRNIYIVVDDDQIPNFLDFSNPRLKLVKHSDIFRDKKCLPTFNSQAIEANLHRIEGLSEYFIYFNDDMFIGRKVMKEELFDKNMKPYYFSGKWSCSYSGKPKKTDKSYIAAWKNNNDVLTKAFPKRGQHCPWHQAQVCVKSLMFELEDKYKDLYDTTSRSKFRTIQNIAPIGLSCVYGNENERYARRKPMSNGYFCVDRLEGVKLRRYLDSLSKRRPKFFCVNNINADHKNIDDIKKFFESYYPKKCSFEK